MASIPVLNTLEEEASKRLIDKIKEVYSYARNYGANLKHLREKHESLCAKKNTIEKRVEVGEKKLEIKTEETTLWLQRVEELIADNQTKELVEDSPRPADASCCFGALHRNYYSRYVISQAADIKAKEIKGILDDVPSEPLTLPLGVEKYEPVPTGAFWEGLESRKELLQLILQKLQDNQVHDIALCGMGAIGKTTLAKEVSKRVHGMFDLIVMVEISEVLDIERIQNQIAETIGLPLDDVHTIEHRAKKLYNRLKHMGEKDGEGEKDEIKGSKKGKEIMVEETKNKVEKKRFMVLLIIDNVWGKLDMGEVGIPQERTSNFCTKFLMTSREKKVCMDMGVSSESIIDVSKLNEDEARNLFRARVGMAEDSEEFRKAEDMLLRKSGGLPLAVVAIADAVKGRNVSVWQQFARKLDNLPTSQLADEYRNIYSILETSYQLMENEEKKMFLLIACLFPLGSRIPIEDIMRLCIGLNVFQYVDKLSEAMEMANSWANELMSSSLLLKDDEQGFVKIHDVVRSSFLSFSEKGGQKIMVDVAPRWLCKETWANFTAISLSAVVDFSRLSGLKSDKLQILILKGNLTQQLDDDLFQGMTNLKVLVLTHMNFKAKLPESVAKLEYLQTLHLKHCELGDVQLIGALVNLLVLSFHKSTFMKSPIEIGNLHRLRLLDFRECRVKPTGISTKVIANLPEMEGLYMPKNFTLEMQTSTVDLSYFRYLNVLEAYFTNVIQLAKDDQFVQRLDRFKIYLFEKDGKKDGKKDKKGDIIEKLAVESQSLLYIENIEANQMTEDCLKALVKKANSLLLHSIRGLKHLGRDLDEDGFRSLKYLVARDCDAMNCIMKIDGKDGNTMFSELEILCLEDMRNLKCIWDGVSSSGMTKELCLPSFQKLKSLDINECPELECLGSPSMLAALPQLETLSIKSCDKLRYVISKDEEICQEILKFPKLKHLKLSGDALISFYGGTHELELPALLHLELEDLPSFTQFASSGNSVGLFHNKFKLTSLEKLSLDGLSMITQLWETPSLEEMSAAYGTSSCSSGFQRLKSLTILGCSELQSLGSPFVAAGLEQLEELTITLCSKIGAVITREREPELPEQVIKFPKLRQLTLHVLENLKCFYDGTYKLQFTALQRLILIELPCITRFAMSGNRTVFFHEQFKLPSLEKLSLGRLRMITQLWETPSLEEMSAARRTSPCSSGFQRLKSLTIFNCDELQSLGSPSVAAGLEQLEELTIEWCPKIGEVITRETRECELPEQVIKFPKLRQLTLEGLDILKFFYNGTYKLQFPALQRLMLTELPCITRFAMSGNRTIFFHEQFKLPSLEELSLVGLRMITQLWETPSLEEMSAARRTSPCSSGFQRLKSLTISDCEELQSLGSPSVAAGLEQLEELTISGCPKIGEVITRETRECELPEQVIKFPKLRQLTLKGLDILKCFYNGTYKLQFSALQRLILTHVPCITRFAMSGNKTVFFHEQIELSSLNYLELKEMCHETDEDIKDLWCIPSAAGEGTVKSAIVNQIPCLRTLVLDNVKLSIPPTTFHSLFDLRLKRWVKDKILFSTSRPSAKDTLILYSQLPKLADLFIEDSTSLEVLFENQGAEVEDQDDAVSAFCAQLKQLTFVFLPKLKPLPGHLYKNLCSINISKLSWKYLFSADIVARDIAQALPLLESVEIRKCQELESVIENELRAGHDVKAPETIEFPRLKHIYLRSLPKARHFNCRSNVTLLLPSLEGLHIEDTGLVSFSPGTVIALKLTKIDLWRCTQMETLFSGDNAIQLPSLRDLSIGLVLRRMQRFSSGPLQAPLLKQVIVAGFIELRMEQNDHTDHPINDYLYSLYKDEQEKRDKIEAQELIPSSSTIHASSEEEEEKSSQASI